MILDIEGAAGIVKKRVPASKNNENFVRLKYFHFPDLPLLDAFVAGVTVNGTVFNIPAVSSIEELVEELNGLSESGQRVCYAYYNKHEFELCVGTQAVTLSAAFAAQLKMGVALAASTCYSSAVYGEISSLYSYYELSILHVRGFHDGRIYNNVIAKIRRDGDVSSAHIHYFKRAVDSIEMSVRVVKKDGTSMPYDSPEIWSLGLEFG